MLAELLRNTTIQMLLLAVLAGMFLGGASTGTIVTVVHRRSAPVRRWIPAASAVGWLAAVALIAAVVVIGTTTVTAVSVS